MFKSSSCARISFKELFEIAIRTLALLIAAFFATIFVVTLFLPIHEIGHALASLAFGLKIFKIEWSGILWEPHSDWRVNAIVRYAGGFFAAFCSSLTYTAVSRIAIWLAHKRPLRINTINFTVLIMKTAILTDIMLELMGGFLEGTNEDIYVQMSHNHILLWGIFGTFFLLSFIIQIFRLNKTLARALIFPKQAKKNPDSP